MKPLTLSILTACWLAFAASSAQAAPLSGEQVADRLEPKPERLQQVDIVEQLGATLPTDLQFITAEGESVRLQQLLSSAHPVLLTFNYSDCPMLCSLQLNGFVDGLRQVERRLGKDFTVLTVSLDPQQDAQRLQEMKARYLAQYLGNEADALTKDAAQRGWHFVRGDRASIAALARAVGFSYTYNEARDEYLHPAAVMMINPSGHIARYLYGIEYHPRTLSLSIVEVSEGKVGGSMDRLLLYCFHYDESEGRYAPMAMNIMRLGGGLTALTLGGVLAVFWRRESRKNKLQATC
jgi:protein SCO1/2